MLQGWRLKLLQAGEAVLHYFSFCCTQFAFELLLQFCITFMTVQELLYELVHWDIRRMPARIIASQARHELHSSSAPKRLLHFFRARRATCPFLLLLAPSIGHTYSKDNKQHTHKDTHTHTYRHKHTFIDTLALYAQFQVLREFCFLALNMSATLTAACVSVCVCERWVYCLCVSVCMV